MNHILHNPQMSPHPMASVAVGGLMGGVMPVMTGNNTRARGGGGACVQQQQEQQGSGAPPQHTELPALEQSLPATA